MTIRMLYLHEWPEDDQRLWASLTTIDGLFDAMGALAHLRPSTLENCVEKYGRWLFWLQTVDPDALLEKPMDRISAIRIRAWMRDLSALAPYSRVMYLDEIIRIVRAGAPESDVAPLRQIRKAHHALAQTNHGSRKKGRIPCAVDLVKAGLEHGTVDAEAGFSDFERARRLRDGAMIAFLGMHPIRRKNFVNLEIGRSIQVSASSVRLVLSGNDTKSHAAYEAMVQEPATGLILQYLREARPVLIAQSPASHDHLWVADTGKPYSYGYIGTRIALLTERLLGVSVPMHFFRDAVATTFARASSDLSRGTRAILGHSSFRIAEQHYNHARGIEAGRDYNAIVRKALQIGKNGTTRERPKR